MHNDGTELAQTRSGQPIPLQLRPPILETRDIPTCLSTGLSLKANVSWTFAGQVVYAGCQWGMLTVLAKLVSPEMVGRFCLGLAITAPIIMFCQLHLRGVQATDARREYAFGHYLALRLTTTGFALLAIAAVTFVSGYRGEAASVILAIGLFKGVESVSDAYHGLMQQRERMDRIALALMIKGPLFLVALALAVGLTGNVLWGVVAMLPPSLVVLMGYERPNARRLLRDEPQAIRPLWQWRRLVILARLALPLGVVMMLISLNTNVPRYFIEHMLGERELGYFGALAYLVVAGNTVVLAMGQSASPRLARHFAAGDFQHYRKLLLRLVGLGALLGLGGIAIALLAGKPLVTLLYGSEYAENQQAFLWLMVSACLSYIASCLGYAMTAARRFAAQLPLFAMVTATTGVASFFLIPRLGLSGAAVALGLGAIAQVAGSEFVVSKALKSRLRETDCHDKT